MTFTGTLANINTALDGLSFTPTANYNGAATVDHLVTDDVGGIIATGSRRGDQRQRHRRRHRHAVNDPVTSTAPATATGNEDTAIAIIRPVDQRCRCDAGAGRHSIR